MKKAGLILPIAMLCLMAVSIFAANPDKRRVQMQNKSNYTLLAGMQQDVEGNIAESYELYKRALETDPENKEAGYRYGLYSLLAGDSARIAQGFELMRDYIEAYPMQYDENIQYAELCDRRADHAEAHRILKRLHEGYPDYTNILYALAQTSLRLGNGDSVLYYLEKAEAIDGAAPEYIPLIAAAYLEKNDTAGLVQEADIRVKEHPGEPAYHLLRALLAHRFGIADSARAYYTSAERLFPNNWNVKRALISYYDDIGDTVASKAAMYGAMLSDDVDFEDKVETFSDYVYPMLMKGNVSAEADTLLLALLDQYPYEADLRSMAAEYYAAQGKLAQACDQIEIAVDMNPDNIPFRSQQVQYLTGAARYADAIKAYESTPEHDGTYPILEIMAASAYRGTGDYDRGICVVDSLLADISGDMPIDRINADNLSHLNRTDADMVAEILGERGTLLYMGGRAEEGAKSFDQALGFSSDSVMLSNNYAYFMAVYGGDLERAASLSKTAIEAEPDNPVYLDTYAYILFRRGEYTEACGYMEKALTLSEKVPESLSAEYYEHYGDILSKLGRTDKALDMWRKALDMDPTRTILNDKIKLKKYIDE